MSDDLVTMYNEIVASDPDTKVFLVGSKHLREMLSCIEVLTARAEAAEARLEQVQCCMCGKTGLSTVEDGGPECQLDDGRWVCSSQCWEKAVGPVTEAHVADEMLDRVSKAVGRITTDDAGDNWPSDRAGVWLLAFETVQKTISALKGTMK